MGRVSIANAVCNNVTICAVRKARWSGTTINQVPSTRCGLNTKAAARPAVRASGRLNSTLMGNQPATEEAGQRGGDAGVAEGVGVGHVARRVRLCVEVRV